jgi:glutaredoxin
MILVELYSKEDCHLCETAKATLLRLRRQAPFELREIKIQEGDPFFDQMSGRVPVIHIGGAYAFHFRVREEEFLARLKALPADPS